MKQTYHLPHGIVGRIEDDVFCLSKPLWSECAATPAALADRYSLPLLAVSSDHGNGHVSFSFLERQGDGRYRDLTYDRETRFNSLLTRQQQRGLRQFRETNVLMARVSWARYHLTRLLEQHERCHCSVMTLLQSFSVVTDFASKSEFLARCPQYAWMHHLPLDELTMWTGDGLSGMTEDLQAFLVAVRSALDGIVALLSCEKWAQARGVRWPSGMKEIANLYLTAGDAASSPIPPGVFRVLSEAWHEWGEVLRDHRDVVVHHGGFGPYGMTPPVWSVAGRRATVAVFLYLPSNSPQLKTAHAVPAYGEWEDSLSYGHATYVRLVRLVESLLDLVTK